MDSRIKADDGSRTQPEEKVSSSVPTVLWSSPGNAPLGAVGDQDGTEYEKDGDFLAPQDMVVSDFERFRIVLPPFIQLGYSIIPPMLKAPPAKVNITQASRLANHIVDCAYLDPDLADAMSNLPDDCKLGIIGEAFNIYMQSPKVIRNEGNNQVPDNSGRGRHGRNSMGAAHGGGGADQGEGGPAGPNWDFGFKSNEAKSWGYDGGFWK